MSKQYKSLMEFALFGKEDEEIDLNTLKAIKSKKNKLRKLNHKNKPEAKP